jgi:hypothetical protein
MAPSAIRAATAAAALVLQASTVFAQPAIVDLRSLRPREVRSTVFTVTAAQDVRVDAIGTEPARRCSPHGSS